MEHVYGGAGVPVRRASAISRTATPVLEGLMIVAASSPVSTQC